jgi:hypothetical protein
MVTVAMQIAEKLLVRLKTKTNKISCPELLAYSDNQNAWITEITLLPSFRRLKHLPQSASFRDQWIYNDLLYAIAGHVAEVWTGSSYEDLVGRKLLQALGMFQAVCGTSIYPSASQSTFALPYHSSNGKLRQGDERIYQSVQYSEYMILQKYISIPPLHSELI